MQWGKMVEYQNPVHCNAAHSPLRTDREVYTCGTKPLVCCLRANTIRNNDWMAGKPPLKFAVLLTGKTLSQAAQQPLQSCKIKATCAVEFRIKRLRCLEIHQDNKSTLIFINSRWYISVSHKRKYKKKLHKFSLVGGWQRLFILYEKLQNWKSPLQAFKWNGSLNIFPNLSLQVSNSNLRVFLSDKN